MPVSLPLRTGRLELRAFSPADLPAIARVYGDPEVMRDVGEGHPANAPTVAQMVRATVDHQAAHGYSVWAMVEREGGAVIGDAGLFRSGEEVELGYTLGLAWWGRGYATEAGRACLDAAFGQAGLTEVIALVIPGNTRSRRVLDKLGMTLAGHRTAYGREHAVYRVEARRP